MSEDSRVFKQIGATLDGLFALDEQGGVWRYYPANKGKGTYAAWYRLTDYRVDNTGPRPKPADKAQVVVDGNI